VDDVRLVEADARRVALFFTDLMLTMAEGGIEGVEAADAVRALWHGPQADVGRMGSSLEPAVLVHGVGAVAAALAAQLVHERRTAGHADASVADVWQQMADALEHGDRRDVESVEGHDAR
jgi:hypothetical protein